MGLYVKNPGCGTVRKPGFFHLFEKAAGTAHNRAAAGNKKEIPFLKNRDGRGTAAGSHGRTPGPGGCFFCTCAAQSHFAA
jgi:hypothetical protein